MAKIIAEALQRKGWLVWWDIKIPPGKMFDETIEKALAESKCVVVLWSKESVNSHWVKEEAQEGLKKKILVPVLIDEVDLPFGFKRIQTAELVNWNGMSPNTEFDKLVDSIGLTVGYNQSSKPEEVNKIPSQNKLETDPDMPIIFICHASEERNKAKALYDQLENNGLRPYDYDKELRGGDQWEYFIRRTIEHEIDYFIVLQSKALCEKRYGYVYKEIYCAINRQKCFKSGIKFIIPVTIDNYRLDELVDFMSIDISSGDSIKELVNMIKKDFFRRKKS